MKYKISEADKNFIMRALNRGDDYEKIEFAFISEYDKDLDGKNTIYEVREAVSEFYNLLNK
jgi:Ca2+-binding EF-hand superfamily protein